MSAHDTIRPLTPGDMPGVKAVIDATGLFASDMLDGMTAGYFNRSAEDDYWLTCGAAQPVAVAYYTPERMTQGAWNLLLIAVHPDQQRKGCGAAILRVVEQAIAAQGARILLVETSGLASFEGTRQFYKKAGYGEEARIRDYYQAGEDKIIFRKALTAS